MIILLFGLFLIPVAILIIRAMDHRHQEMTGPATVLSHRVAHRSEMPKDDAPWISNLNYLVSFTLSDGEEIELYTLLSDYQTLKNGTSGQLTWQGKRFLDFEAD